MATCLFLDKGGIRKPACLMILEKIEAYAKEIIDVYFHEDESAADAFLILHQLEIAFIETLKGSEIPKELRNEVIGSISMVIASIPPNISLQNALGGHLKELRSHLQMQYTREKCGKISECSQTARPNFKCLNCGYEHTVFFRRELLDLNDPAEGELAMQIMAGACGWERIDGK